jgi:hypothetical protein
MNGCNGIYVSLLLSQITLSCLSTASSCACHSHKVFMVCVDRQQLIDGTEVILETYSKSRTPVSDDFPRHGPESPAPGHHDLITDVTLCHSSQPLIVSASRDGVVKVWK